MFGAYLFSVTITARALDTEPADSLSLFKKVRLVFS